MIRIARECFAGKDSWIVAKKIEKGQQRAKLWEVSYTDEMVSNEGLVCSFQDGLCMRTDDSENGL